MLAFIPQMLSEGWGVLFYGKTYLLKVMKDEQGRDGCKRWSANIPCFTEDSPESTEEKLVP